MKELTDNLDTCCKETCCAEGCCSMVVILESVVKVVETML